MDNTIGRFCKVTGEGSKAVFKIIDAHDGGALLERSDGILHGWEDWRKLDMQPKYPEVTVQLTGEDGNAFAIMGRITKALRKAGASKEEIKQYQEESMAGDYNNLLRVAMEWVDVQ